MNDNTVNKNRGVTQTELFLLMQVMQLVAVLQLVHSSMGKM
jgi:hypothetical protein